MESDHISVIDTQSFLRLTDKNSPFILVIHKGENLINALLQCFKALNIQGASLSGLGAVENPKIAYFDRRTKTYREKMFLDEYELISMNGNLGLNEEKKPVLHIHAALGDKQYNVIGGHLVDAMVSITTEVTVIPLKQPIIRKFNSDLGLKLISVKL